VKILDGGKIAINNKETFYLAMEFIPGTDLREHISQDKRFSDAEIRRILNQLHIAADFLIKAGCCHRDIKVDNIRMKENGDVVLLDLGVIKPVGASSLTDHASSGNPFIGTLRYSPPELLHRKENDTLEGWTAVTIYQIGTVLYELIQGVRLFNDVPDDPYADVVSAVDSLQPTLLRGDVGTDLIKFTKAALLKIPQERLQMISWDKTFATIIDGQPVTASFQRYDVEKALLEIQQKHAEMIEGPKQRRAEAEAKVRRTESEIEQIVKSEALLIHPTATIKAEFAQHSDVKISMGGSVPQLFLIQFGASLSDGLVVPMRLSLRTAASREVSSHVTAQGLGLRGYSIGLPNQNPRDKLLEMGQTFTQMRETVFDDFWDTDAFRNSIREWFSQMLGKYLVDTKEDLEKEMAEQNRLIESSKRGGVSVRFMPKEIFVFNRESSRQTSNEDFGLPSPSRHTRAPRPIKPIRS
jgi:hypothetical protein